MKMNLMIAIALFTATLAAAAPVNVTCATDPLTTSFAIFTTGDDVTVRVIHHNGSSYMPLSRQTITPSDLSGLQQKAAALEPLGDQYDLHIKASNCRLTSDKLVDCHGPIDQTVSGRKFTWLYVTTSKITTVSPVLSEPSVRTAVDVDFTMDGKDYDFGMEYEAGACVETSGSAAGRPHSIPTNP